MDPKHQSGTPDSHPLKRDTGFDLGVQEALFGDALPVPVRKKKKRVRPVEIPLHSARKALLVAEYLRLFIFVTKHGTYIDGFAGPQSESMDQPGTWSARLVLENEPKWLRHFHLFDLGDLQIQRLKRLRKELGDGRDIQIYSGDFNDEVLKVLTPGIIGKKEATFALLDQRCFECKWSTVERLADYKRPRIELLYFLAEGWLDRSLASATRDPKLEQIEAWWGRSDVEKVRAVTGVARANLFCERFRELGYQHVAPWAIQGEDETGTKRTMYFLIHASDHDEAPKFMRRAYNKMVLPRAMQMQTTLRLS